ncbi:MAG: NYN domain-containing protein, partial [Bacteroidota bacterium]
DFEPLHDAVMALEYGKYWYRKLGEGDQPEAVDIRGILDFAKEQAETIAFNQAYGNWRWMSSYGSTMERQGVRLIQLFPEGRSNQNRADREIGADLDRILAAGEIKNFLFVGGGERLLPLVEKIKAVEGTVHGLGPRATADEAWVTACDAYNYYTEVARPLQDERNTFKPAEESHPLLVQTMINLSNQYGEEWTQQVRIKPALVRLDPDFREKDYGYPSFGIFLQDQTAILERRHQRNEQEPEYRLRPDLELTEEQKQSFSRATNRTDLAPYYLRVAAQQGVRMPRPDVMWIGVDIYASFLIDDARFPNFGDLDDECLHQLQQDVPEATLTDAKKIRQVLFKCYIFRPSEDGSIGFHESVQTLEDVENRYFNLMLSRIGNNIQEELDYEALSRALTDSEDSAERLRELDTQE